MEGVELELGASSQAAQGALAAADLADAGEEAEDVALEPLVDQAVGG